MPPGDNFMFNPQPLPTEFDLPETDNKPVDNELQILAPALLRAILSLAWQDRNDWFMGINLGIYYKPKEAAVGPDAFLSLGVPTYRLNGQLRLSYVVWTEGNVIPQWVLEIVSKTPGGEYDDKFRLYEEMGVLYYVIYNPDHWKRDRHQPFEVYRWVNGQYIQQLGNPVWMPEIDLGIGMEVGVHSGLTRSWVYWYDAAGQRLPAPENVIQQERQRAEQEYQRAEQERRRAEQAEQQLQILRERLRQQGVDLDLPSE
jgi:Uma2 family endonuclease